MPDPEGPTPIPLTIRFSSAHPDLPLDVFPSTPIASLKSTLRTSIPTLAKRRLRLIHQGKILPDGSSLLSALDPKGKGKLATGARVFVNCSIGDQLSDGELEEEARLAATPTEDAHGRSVGGEAGVGGAAIGSGGGIRPRSTQRTPRGFDRLLAAGFTAAEVNQLRLQFTSIQATRHTPDTMPSPDTLRNMEDSWIDDNGAGMAAANGEENPEDGGGLVGDLLDVFLQGIVSGFFLPLGSLCWLLREDGLWSKRRHVAVVFGVVVSVAIGLFKAIAGEAE